MVMFMTTSRIVGRMVLIRRWPHMMYTCRMIMQQPIAMCFISRWITFIYNGSPLKEENSTTGLIFGSPTMKRVELIIRSMRFFLLAPSMKLLWSILVIQRSLPGSLKELPGGILARKAGLSWSPKFWGMIEVYFFMYAHESIKFL